MTIETRPDPPQSQTALFELLSDETRLAIVRELYRHERTNPAAPGISFSSLGKRLDVDDSGRFNYHLRRLRGSLVEKRGDRYVLTTLGIRLGAFVVDEPVSLSVFDGSSREH
ncbi:winged helix-turn-helix domain-containing protein [Halovivax gelatinilyticus]|uniref:winged helix-turn-helix domain-containing protein n=1 Tax=Halovivax gelatinilyticus TaxID=2961597 RepID=UPI0020CA44A7|nr:helix-turn-helix domain-containing protein [Halovivax gelatinilyticus]